MNIKQNIPLIAGLLIPVLMVVFVAASIYLPKRSLNPQYDFLYTTESYPSYTERVGDSYVSHRYYVDGDTLAEETAPLPTKDGYYSADLKKPMFYRYDVKTNTSTKLTLEDAKKLKLNDARKSPDGLEVVHGSNTGGVFPFFFFDENNYNTVYLKQGNASRKLDITADNRYPGITFIAWITN